MPHSKAPARKALLVRAKCPKPPALAPGPGRIAKYWWVSFPLSARRRQRKLRRQPGYAERLEVFRSSSFGDDRHCSHCGITIVAQHGNGVGQTTACAAWPIGLVAIT
jgi:hypothetical protein